MYTYDDDEGDDDDDDGNDNSDDDGDDDRDHHTDHIGQCNATTIYYLNCSDLSKVHRP